MASEKEMIVLMSKEGQTFEVEKKAALLSQTLKNILDDNCTDIAGGIPLPNVDSATLAANRSDEEKNLTDFHSDYINSLKDDHNSLFDLILAASYLDIGMLLHLTEGVVVNLMRGQTIEQIRKIFHIKTDYSPEEEAEVRKEVAWAFRNEN